MIFWISFLYIIKMDFIQTIIHRPEYQSLDYIGKKVIEEILVNKKNVFLSGPGGTGKSFIIKALRGLGKCVNKNVDITSTTGISAVNVSGCTIHRWSGIRLGKESVQKIVKRIKNNKQTLNRWRSVDILCIDEISMFGMKNFELIEEIARNILDKTKVFGGIQLVLTGDFFQLEPVNDEFCFMSQIWHKLNLTYVVLEESKRFENRDHFEMLNRMRKGNLTEKDIEYFNSRVEEYHNGKYDGNILRFFSTNIEASNHNIKQLSELKGNEIIYKCTDSFERNIEENVIDNLKDNYSKDNCPLCSHKLHTCKLLPCDHQFHEKCLKFYIKKNKNCMVCNTCIVPDVSKVSEEEINEYRPFLDDVAPPEVSIKEGASALITFNLDVDDGICNGTKCVIKKVYPDSVEVYLEDGREYLITPIVFECLVNNIYLYRRQIPLKIAFALTLHKSQSLTLDKAIMDLGYSIFAPGMAYVGASRVKNPNGLYLINFNSKKVVANPDVIEFDKDVMYLNVVPKWKLIKECFYIRCPLCRYISKYIPSEEKEEKSECSICMEEKKLQKLISCSHSFCVECLAHLVISGFE